MNRIELNQSVADSHVNVVNVMNDALRSQEEFVEFVQGLYVRSQSRALARDPSPNSFALQPDTLSFLLALADWLDPTVILEFGSGESTHIFASWTVDKRVRLVSVEHDKIWSNRMRDQIATIANLDYTLFYRPLRFRFSRGRLFFTYRALENQLPSIASKAALVLIDGPHFSGREAVLYFALRHCSPGTIIVMDDWNQRPAKEMLAPLLRSFPPPALMHAELEENSHGLLVLQIGETLNNAYPPAISVRQIARSYWRCYLDWRHYGSTGK